MNRTIRHLAPAAVIAISAIGAAPVRADDHNAYLVTNLVSDLKGVAAFQDKVLMNSWGVTFTPAGSPFWIADNATGCATLYDGDGTIVPLQVNIPLPTGVPATDCKPVDPKNPPNPTPAAPTGTVWNPASAFTVPGTKIAAVFIFDTEDGTVSAWAPGLSPSNNAVIAVDNSKVPNATNGAVYKGLAFGVNAKLGPLLFATNFRAGTVDVFGPPGTQGGLFTPVTTGGGFSDPFIPTGFAPFGIQNINGNLYVTYAKQNGVKHDDVAGPGNGFVDVFDTDGNLVQRLASRGVLNSPWGVARASAAFGRFSGDILIGNFGNGQINAFDQDGHLDDTLKGLNHKPLTIDGLWTLTLGGGAKSNPDTLYFTAGPNGETDGLFGTITPVGDGDNDQDDTH
jgi:uncharacterized protein (TIGR03118 family)